MKRVLTICLCGIIFSCSLQKKIAEHAHIILQDSLLRLAHTGISIYDVHAKKFVYNHQAENYFIPASNVKLFTLFAGLKYLPDSLPGLHVLEYANDIVIEPTGDPTFLHPAFQKQPVFDFLKNTKKEIQYSLPKKSFQAWGKGWSWDDYTYAFMAERSLFPIYGNVVRFDSVGNMLPLNNVFNFRRENTNLENESSNVFRELHSNSFVLNENKLKAKKTAIPFITSIETSIQLLVDTLHKNIQSLTASLATSNKINQFNIKSQPTDSVLKRMMYYSDNFLAEQLLLMCGNNQFGVMDEERMIDSFLQRDCNGLKQKIRWVDGSGLSRYNQFTPKSFIYILQKLYAISSWDRLCAIIPPGNKGSLTQYFIEEDASIHAKTGSMSNVIALSGYLLTKKKKLLLFSVLVNDFPGAGADARKRLEMFLHQLYVM